ncbi:MAG: signal peptidase II [Terriglobales bacterium]
MAGSHDMRKYHFLGAVVVFLADQVSKWVITQRIVLHESITVIPGFFRLTHVVNRGAAFGLLSESDWNVAILILFSLVALAVVSALLWRNSHRVSSTGFGLALILGGAVGNLWDRLLEGHVVDFLDFHLGGYHWPAFNVADSAIVIGALLLVAQILFAKASAGEKALSGR